MIKPDKELLEGIENKSPTAFTELYRRYKNLIYSQIDSRVFDKDVVDDLFQEFWITIWNKPSIIRTDHNGTAKKSLSYILSFQIIAYFRTLRSSIVTLENNDLTASNEPSYSHVDEDLFAREIRSLIDKIVEGLPEMDRLIYDLHENKDWSLDQIAEHLNISKKTVSNRLSLISKEIRTEISPLSLMIGTNVVMEVLRSFYKSI